MPLAFSYFSITERAYKNSTHIPQNIADVSKQEVAKEQILLIIVLSPQKGIP